ncbi:MAG: hypothetical protein JXA30_20405 [Deltaproteobacteria bacterium]|nr:hypothetical protein [Deltaproteobacteria bacterium]
MRSFIPVIALVLIMPSFARARSESEFAYPFSRVWTIAVRLLRIDLDCPIKEKDREEGYFFFEYRDNNRSFSGSAELIPMAIDGTQGVRVAIQLPELPKYVERMILDRLARKLDTELGQPMRQKPEKDPKPAQSKSGEKKKVAADDKSDGK